jgi:hypothetical protein
VATHPDSYESRLTEMFPDIFRHLRLLALDPYDLALTKLTIASRALAARLTVTRRLTAMMRALFQRLRFWKYESIHVSTRS